MAHPWLAAGGALPPLHQEQGPGNGHAAANGAAEEAQEEELEEQKQQLLAASLQGLVDSGLQVQHFAAGEALMTRGQQGKLFPVEGVALLACCACVPACLPACPPACLACMVALLHKTTLHLLPPVTPADLDLTHAVQPPVLRSVLQGLT
jgi:hypothetical protein